MQWKRCHAESSTDDRSQPGASARLLGSLEAAAYDNEDCEEALATFERAKPMLAASESSAPGAADDRKLVGEILQRPEFQHAPARAEAKPKDDAATTGASSGTTQR